MALRMGGLFEMSNLEAATAPPDACTEVLSDRSPMGMSGPHFRLSSAQELKL
jgi:hypothetical protein